MLRSPARVPHLSGFCLVLLAGAPAALQTGGQADAADRPSSSKDYNGLEEALGAGRVWLDFRYRFEYVDADGFSRNANANTLRTVLGYESGRYFDTKLFLEFEDVSDITDDYNSTTNGNTEYPVVADPDTTEINQAFLEFAGMEESLFRLGRQEILLDNQRFVGNVVWRQNHQSYDAFSWTNHTFENTTLFFSYIDQVNRVFGDESPVGDVGTDTLLFNAGYDLEGWGKATAYWYELDNENQVLPSSSTFGARFAGARPVTEEVTAVYAGEFANQTDTGNNPNSLDQDYYLVEVGASIQGWEVLGAVEHLGGSGDPGDAFQTPLATLFKFNGYADQFLVTPPNGLADYYAVVSGNIEKIGCYAAYHVFESDSGGLQYGTELDVRVTYPFTPELVGELQWAAFDGDEGGFVDVTKFWVTLSYAAL